MPPLPPSPGVTRAVLNATLNNIPVANVLHFTQPGGGTAPDPALLASRLGAWWGSTMKPLVVSNYTLNNITCTDLSPSGPPSTVFTTSLPNSGTLSGDALPGNCALVMSLRTALRGRSFRGRIYHCGIGESQTLLNSVQTPARDSILGAWDDLVLFTQIGQPDYQLVVLSYYANGDLRSEGLATPVVSMSANTRIDTQRRRLT